ncbi:MAG: hypothetical protein V2J24_05625 [Pseudomonadales bacterium]|jgi:hypothetical protein|nr:hypothetical protein [Pseudomonadales bacterium]
MSNVGAKDMSTTDRISPPATGLVAERDERAVSRRALRLVCAWCGAVRAGISVPWPDGNGPRSGPAAGRSHDGVDTHGICDTCRERLVREHMGSG